MSTYDEIVGGPKKYSGLSWALASGKHWKLLFAECDGIPLDTEGNELLDNIAYVMESGIGIYPVDDEGNRVKLCLPK